LRGYAEERENDAIAVVQRARDQEGLTSSETHRSEFRAMSISEQETRFFGKYRGTVIQNIDPMILGRLIVEVPAVRGVTSTWALPCTPYAGPGVGMLFLPPIGANVWVEFEAGDPDYPIWTGCFWSPGEVPGLSSGQIGPAVKVIKTESMTIVIDDTPGAGGVTVTIQSRQGSFQWPPPTVELGA
jgi:hypothetical protein